jgi:hypothetical protein
MLHLDKLLALPANIRLGCKGRQETNTLAYYKKSFITLGPGSNVTKLFKAVGIKFL